MLSCGISLSLSFSFAYYMHRFAVVIHYTPFANTIINQNYATMETFYIQEGKDNTEHSRYFNNFLCVFVCAHAHVCVHVCVV